MVVIYSDLYTEFTNRFGWVPVLNEYPDAPTTENIITKSRVFYGLFRILLGCDAAHDFTSDRGGFSPTEKPFFSNAMGIYVLKDLSIFPGLSTICEKLINYRGYKIYGNKSYFVSDVIAKNTVQKILDVLGLKSLTLDTLGHGDCTSDNSISRMIKILNIANRRRNNPDETIEIRVDATQDTLNMIPIYSAIVNQKRRVESGCPVNYNIKLVTDISSEYDAANSDKLQKTLNVVGMGDITLVDTVFNITCGVDNDGVPLNIVKCSLAQANSTDNEIITLTLEKYFTTELTGNTNRLAKDPDNLNVSNDKTNGESNNSVKGLSVKIRNLLTSTFGQSWVTDYHDTLEINKLYYTFYKYTIPKTMGDFLQIISFIKSPSNNKLFITADILSSKICALFSKFSFLERIKENNFIISGMGLYMTQVEEDFHKNASILMELAGPGALTVEPDPDIIRNNKRQRFGKKTKSNKIKHMPIEQLKSKLKSIGINVTKITRSGKRLPLTRKELERKAVMFKNLQLRAKKMGIKIMYKSRSRGYVYKSYIRLMNEIEKKRTKRVSKFG